MHRRVMTKTMKSESQSSCDCSRLNLNSVWCTGILVQLTVFVQYPLCDFRFLEKIQRMNDEKKKKTPTTPDTPTSVGGDSPRESPCVSVWANAWPWLFSVVTSLFLFVCA